MGNGLLSIHKHVGAIDCGVLIKMYSSNTHCACVCVDSCVNTQRSLRRIDE